MKLFLCKLIFTCAAAVQPEVSPRSELAYGTVLYDFYQQNYSDALLSVRVAQARGHAEGVETKFALAEGSFAFSDQMFDYSREVFDSVDPEELTELDNLRLAFHLSREYFRIGDWERLEQSLAQIDLGTRRFSGKQKFHPEVEFMRSELALNRGDLEAARSHLETLGKNDIHRMYGLYNLGGALRASGDMQGSEDAFAEVAGVKIKSADRLVEMQDLQQRALLAQAFLQREKGETRKAEKILGDLPAQGRYRDLALASFGALAMESGDYELAARVWLSLQQQSAWNPSSASARLCFPLSLENMQRQDLALAHYRSAEQNFSARAVKLDELSEQVEDKQWVRDLLSVFAEGRGDPKLLEDWNEQLGHTDWLEWISAESVDSLLVQWRDLRRTNDWLQSLPSDLATYQELALEQRRRAKAVKAALSDNGLASAHALLEQKIDQQLAALEALKSHAVVPDADFLLALANPEQTQRLQRLQKMYEFSSRLDAEAASQWRSRLDRLRGVVFWEISDSRPVVLQQMRQLIADVESLSDSMQAQAMRLQAAESGLQAGVLADFTQFKQRANDLAARVERALDNREEQLALELKRGMQNEAQQVQKYLLTARIAIARTLDQYAAIEEVSP